jgi:pyrroline-5-carboxylate reductase
MTLIADTCPLLLLGAGHMGGALVAGWLSTGTVAASEILIRDPHPGQAALAAVEAGARLNPSDDNLGAARTVVLALKPQIWRDIAADMAGKVGPEAVVISIMAGVKASDISEVFPGRPIVRAMPNTAAAVGKGATGVWSADSVARAKAHALFAPLGAVADLAEESLIHAVTAASGSAPAYVYALVEALEHAGASAGLAPEAARSLSRAALIGAAALLEASGEEASELRRQVTSPKGTTEAALEVLTGAGALDDLVARAVFAAQGRSRQLGGDT